MGGGKCHQNKGVNSCSTLLQKRKKGTASFQHEEQYTPLLHAFVFRTLSLPRSFIISQQLKGARQSVLNFSHVGCDEEFEVAPSHHQRFYISELRKIASLPSEKILILMVVVLKLSDRPQMYGF